MSKGFPCGHALAILFGQTKFIKDYVKPYFTVDSFARSYAGAIVHPHTIDFAAPLEFDPPPPPPAPTPAPTRQHFLMMTMMEVTQMLLSSFLPAHDVLLEGRRSVVFAAGLKSWSLGLLNVKNVVDARRWGPRGVPEDYLLVRSEPYVQCGC